MAEDVVNEYPAERLASFRSQIDEATATIKKMRVEAYEGHPTRITLDELTAIEGAFNDVRSLAYALDEAMTTLHYYAAEATWTEVPQNTPAATDRGTKARVALARINPV